MSKAIAATLVPRYTDKAHKAENIAIEMIIALTKLMMMTMGTMTWCTVPGEREGEVGRAGYGKGNANADNGDK